MDKNDIARLLALAAGFYNRRAHLALDPGRQVAACRELNAFGVLSLSAIAACVGITPYKVERNIVGMERPKARGKLNPEHLPWLAYMQDGHARPAWVHNMVTGGTSISTIEDLTGISRSTLNRRK